MRPGRQTALDPIGDPGALSERDIQLRIFAYPGSWEFTERWIDWRRLDLAERQELERLLAKAADRYRPTV